MKVIDFDFWRFHLKMHKLLIIHLLLHLDRELKRMNIYTMLINMVLHLKYLMHNKDNELSQLMTNYQLLKKYLNYLLNLQMVMQHPKQLIFLI